MSKRPDHGDVRQQLEAILERISNIIYIKDRQGRYLLMNSAGEALFDMPREEIVGQRDEDLFDREAADEIRSIDTRVMETQTSATYVSQRSVQGEERIFRNEKYPYVPDRDTVRGIIGISKDITEERRRQRAIELLHGSTRQLFTATTKVEIAELTTETADEVLNLPTNTVHLYDEEVNSLVPVAWSDPAKLMEDATPPIYEAGEGVAWTVFTTGVAQSYADVRAADEVFNSETLIRSELLLPLGEHGVLMIGSTDVDDFDEGDEALAQVLTANVEAALDRVEREQELHRQNERLQDFASVLSHDIRNPLNIAQLQTGLLEEDPERADVDTLEKALGRINAVIEDVMIWAQEGQTIEETAPVNVNRIARSCWQAVATDDASLVVADDFAIDADRDRLARVFENLFRNAIEHGGPDVTMTVGRLDDESGFYVDDTGPGIPDDERETVFETGFTTTETGTGFGLAICEEIADAHGWSLSATESDAGGARFEFTGVNVSDV